MAADEDGMVLNMSVFLCDSMVSVLDFWHMILLCHTKSHQENNPNMSEGIPVVHRRYAWNVLFSRSTSSIFLNQSLKGVALKLIIIMNF